MKAVFFAGVVAAITINYFASPDLNPLVSEKLFSAIRDEATLLDIPHDPYMMLSANNMADHSTKLLADAYEPVVVETRKAWTSGCNCCAGHARHPEKELVAQETYAVNDSHIICEITTIYERSLAIVPVKKEIQTAEIIYEEPIKIDYQVNVYPNPFTTQATFEIGNYDGEPYRFAIYDLSGKQIEYHENVTDNRITINRRDLAPGVYIYRMVTASESNIKSGKIIIQ